MESFVIINNKSALSKGISLEQRENISKITEEELQKIAATFKQFQDAKVEVRIKFCDSHSRWGTMEKRGCTSSEFYGTITLAKMTVLADNYGEKLRNTIMHELLHLFASKHGHKGPWKEMANAINNKYGYNIKRTSNGKDFGVPEDITKVREREYKYMIKCTNCGKIYRYKRLTRAIKMPKRYYCGICKQYALVSEKL